MAISATCECGQSFSLRDEFAGRLLECPACRKSFTAPPPIARAAQADHAFDRDKFLLRQKVISISEQYEVGDEQNRPILYVLRPAHALQNGAALLAAIVAFIAVFVLFLFLGNTIFGERSAGVGAMAIAGVVLGFFAALCAGIICSAKRHVTFYRDKSKSEKLMDVLQDAKFQPINSTFTLRDKEGQVLARFRKNVLTNFFRKRWNCYGPGGGLICSAIEDSILLSLLRRFLGTFYGLLRTNFIILAPESGRAVSNDAATSAAPAALNYSSPSAESRQIGEFNRKFTLFDRYVLDLSADPTRTLDRRIALALGVMLDTGEKR